MALLLFGTGCDNLYIIFMRKNGLIYVVVVVVAAVPLLVAGKPFSCGLLLDEASFLSLNYFVVHLSIHYSYHSNKEILHAPSFFSQSQGRKGCIGVTSLLFTSSTRVIPVPSLGSSVAALEFPRVYVFSFSFSMSVCVSRGREAFSVRVLRAHG